jgi:hypothetical protein
VNPNLLFRLVNNAALLGWILLIFLPRWRWSARLIAPVLVPALLAALYSWLAVTQFGPTPATSRPHWLYGTTAAPVLAFSSTPPPSTPPPNASARRLTSLPRD